MIANCSARRRPAGDIWMDRKSQTAYQSSIDDLYCGTFMSSRGARALYVRYRHIVT